MSDPTTTVKLTTDTSALISGLKDATSSFKTFATGIENQTKGLTQVLGNIKAPFIALSALLGAGIGLKKMADETVAWTLEVNKLSKSLGISTQTASGWAVALHTLGIDQETLTGVTSKINMLVAEGSDKFHKWGVSVKDSSGHILNNAQIINNLADKYSSLHTQTEKGLMLADLFGRKQLDVQQILRVTSERLAEARKEAQDFGLEVGPDGVAKARSYQEALNSLSMVGKGLANQIGKELIPIITDLANWFKGSGKDAIQGFGTALKVLMDIWYGFKFVIEVVTISVTEFVDNAITVLQGLAKVALDLIHGDFSLAVQDAKAGGQAIVAENEAAAEGVKKAWEKLKDSHKNLWNPKSYVGGGQDDNATGPLPKGDGKPKKEKGDSDPGGVMEEALWEEKYLEKQRQIKLELAKLSVADQLDQSKYLLAMKKEYLDEELEAGRITQAQYLKAVKQEKLQEMQVDIKALQDEQALLKNEPVKFQQIENQILQIKRKTALDIKKIDNQMAKEQMKVWKEVGATIKKSMSSAISSVLSGSKSAKSAISDMFGSLKDALIQMAVDAALNWAESMLMTKIESKSTASSEIASGAGVAAVNAMSSAAAIPIVGWAMSAGVGAETYAAAMAYMSSLASFATGIDYVPNDQLAHIHEGEAILNKPANQKLTDYLDNANGGGDVHVHFHGAIDAKQFFKENEKHIANTIKSAVRNNKLQPVTA